MATTIIHSLFDSSGSPLLTLPPLPVPNVNNFYAYKPLSMTPRELIDFYISRDPDILKKGCFTGRLDPMAHGIMHLFFNEGCQSEGPKRANAAKKKYRFKMVLGVTTSSCDLMGFAKYRESNSGEIMSWKLDELVENAIRIISQRREQTLPIYSSQPVTNHEGLKKPLWWWAYTGRTNEIKIPTKLREIEQFIVCGVEYKSLREICDVAIERVDRVNRQNKFQQAEIIAMWQEIRRQSSPLIELPIITVEVTVSSGFYIRKLVEDIGELIEYPATTYEIERLEYINNN
jgi:tRNA U55 pseudouridine synthase TruB